MRTLLALLILAVVVTPSGAADRGYFNCFRTHMTAEQKAQMAAWFSSPAVVGCCDLADGMPGFVEDRADGLYMAPHDVTLALAEACRDNPGEPLHDPPTDHSAWIKVEPDRLLRRANPIGVAVVWWLDVWPVWLPRCVVDQARL